MRIVLLALAILLIGILIGAWAVRTLQEPKTTRDNSKITDEIRFSVPPGWNDESINSVYIDRYKYEGSCDVEQISWLPRGFSTYEFTSFPGVEDKDEVTATISTFRADDYTEAFRYDSTCYSEQEDSTLPEASKEILELSVIYSQRKAPSTLEHLPFSYSIYNTQGKHYQLHYVESVDGRTRGVAFFANDYGNGAGSFRPYYVAELYNEEFNQVILMSFALKPTPEIKELNKQLLAEIGTKDYKYLTSPRMQKYHTYLQEVIKNFPNDLPEEFQPAVSIDRTIIASLALVEKD